MADNISEAIALIQLDNPPADIEDQLKALEAKASDLELLEFPWIWEAWATRQDELGATELKD
jgi:hypothetical protein